MQNQNDGAAASAAAEGHHPYGASRIGLRDACGASRAMEELAGGMGKLGDRSEQARGRKQHEATHDDDALGELEGFDRELVERARQWHERGGMGLQWFEEIRIGPMKLEGIGRDLWPFGTLDRLAFEGREVARVRDFKFGPLPLKMEEVGPQMGCYAGLVLDRYEAIEEVHVEVLHVHTMAVFNETYRRRQLAAIKKKWKEVIERGEARPLWFSPGWHCSRCDGAVVCDHAQKEAGETQLEVLEAVTPRSGGELVGPERAAELIPKAKVAIKVMQDFVKFWTAWEKEHPGALEGLRREERSRRRIVEQRDLFALLRRFVKPEKLVNFMNFTVTGAENAFVEGYLESFPDRSKKEARDVFRNMTAGLIVEDESGFLVEEPRS